MSELCNIGYKGYYYDSGAKLYYTGTRYYNPETGRYLSPNKATNLQINAINGLNLFDFYNNNPLRPIALTKGEYKVNINAMDAPRLETQAQPLPDCFSQASEIIDFSLSIANIARIYSFSRSNPHIVRYAQFLGIQELPLKFSKLVNKIGYGFVFLDVIIDIYSNSINNYETDQIILSAIGTLLNDIALIKLTGFTASKVLSLFKITSYVSGGIITLFIGIAIDIILQLIIGGI